MLEYLLIQNFQVHRKLRVDFGESITTIVGPSDAGKSAILRALRWVCTNHPGGEAFIRHGAKGATVTLAVDGHTITRKRSRGGEVNDYILDGEELKAFGRGVPDRVAAILNLGSMAWQLQHDAAYWFSDTAGEVSRQLNSIVNLGVIDDTLAGCAKTLHRARTKLEMAGEGLTEAKAVNDALDWVEKFDADLVLVEVVESGAEKARERATHAAALTQAAQRHLLTHQRAETAASRGEAMVTAGALALARANVAAEMRKLVKIAREHRATAERNVPSTRAMSEVKDRYEHKLTSAGLLWEVIREAKRLARELCLKETQLTEATAALPERCPTSGQFLPPTSTSKHGHQ